jgi:dephospho-CoA kinase
MVKIFKIGITGGIGSGKTTVAKIFMQLGIPVFFADDEAKVIVNHNPLIREKLINAFGASAYVGDVFNKKYFADLIFNNNEARERMNAIVHPAVKAEFEDWTAKQQSPYVLQEAAILFETGGYKRFDKNILVYAPQEVRLQRVMERNGISRNEVLARMAMQGNPEAYRSLANFVIENDGVLPLIPQVLKIHQSIMAEVAMYNS